MNECQSLQKLVYGWIIYRDSAFIFIIFKSAWSLFFFFNFLLIFNVRGQNFKKASFYTNKSIVFIIIYWKNGALLSPQHILCRRTCMNSKKIKIFKNLGFRDTKCLVKKFSELRICIHITVISDFHVQLVSKSASWKMLGLKLIKLDFIIIYLDLDTIKKARD